jgi:DOMON domain/Eukaryotic cytochrome b561
MISRTLLLLTGSLLSFSLIQGQSTDCPLGSDIDLAGDGSFLLRQVVNPSDSTVSVELEYMGTGWVGFAFSTTATMIPNTAIIGLPDDDTVLKYDLTIRDISGVLPASADRQTLTNASIVQANGITTLKFTRALSEANETTVVPGTTNTILVAYGLSNTLGNHLFRLPTTATFTECGAAIPVAPSAAPVAAPTTRGSELIDLGNRRTQSVASFQSGDVVLTFVTDEVKQALTVTMEYAGLGWIGFGISKNGQMPNSLAIIALPDDGTGAPLKYDMGSERSESAIVVASTERQTLTEASYTQNATHTTMTFTKLLVETNELPISLAGNNYFLYAVGSSNTFGYHASRRGFARDFANLAAPSTSTSESSNKSLWIAHGVLMVIAWTILVPLAVGTAVLRNFLTLPTGQWFRIHRLLNSIAVACTIAGFSIAVHIIKKEDGSSADHFTNTIKHHKIGLVVFLFAILQALSGYFRPHLPHKPEPDVMDEEAEGDKAPVDDDAPLKKSRPRIAFEILHRLMGTTAMILGWVNVDSGIGLYNQQFGGKDLTPAAWVVTGGIVGVVALCYTYDQFFKKKA